MREDDNLTKNMPFITQGKANLKYILIVVVLAAIAGGGILAYQYWWAPKEKAPSIETTALKTYTNDRFKYSIKYPNDWHIFSELTKRLGAMGFINAKYPFGGEVNEGEIDNYYKEHETEMENFMNSWKANDSELIILADTSPQEEKVFIENVDVNKKTLGDFYPSHAIFIYPTNLSADVKSIDRKEIKIEAITLSNSAKALRIHRRLEPEQVEIYVPHESDTKLYGGESVKSLEFLIYLDKGNYPEDVFMDIINSLEFLD